MLFKKKAKPLSAAAAQFLPGRHHWKVIDTAANTDFRFPYYIRFNQRRLEHLASLRLPLAGKRVLEVGAGPGDLTSFFTDRGCAVHATDGRPELVEEIAAAYAGRGVTSQVLDLDSGAAPRGGPFEVVFCYGVLYHLRDPLAALRMMSGACSGLLLLETCVSYGGEEAVNLVEENRAEKSQAVSGTGCRPTRPWMFNRLKEMFEHVYCPVTQPAHDEFPQDWTRDERRAALTRAVFIASRRPIESRLLVPGLPERHVIEAE